jgi:hypothetical protein
MLRRRRWRSGSGPNVGGLLRRRRRGCATAAPTAPTNLRGRPEGSLTQLILDLLNVAIDGIATTLLILLPPLQQPWTQLLTRRWSCMLRLIARLLLLLLRSLPW